MGSSKSKSSSYSGEYSNSYRHTQSIYWEKYGNTWVTNVSGKITGDVIQDIIGDFGSTLDYDDRQLFLQARSEIMREWGVFLKNATVKIYTGYITYIINSGDGTNVLTISRNGHGDIVTDWSGGFFRPVRNVFRGIGRFMFRILGPVASIASGGMLPIGWW